MPDLHTYVSYLCHACGTGSDLILRTCVFKDLAARALQITNA